MGGRRRGSVPQTIGGVLVGFDEQVWSKRPPAQERVEQVDRLGTIVSAGGITVAMPAAVAERSGSSRCRPPAG